MSRLKRLCEWTLLRRFPAIPIALGVALAAPSLFVGIQADDLFIRSVMRGSDLFKEFTPRRWEPYTYLVGDPVRNHVLIDHGWMPWWTDPQCKVSLGRPLTALTFMLDYCLWPAHPVLMHLQSLVWYGLLIWAAAVLYRRMTGHSAVLWSAALAALLYAADEAHAIPAGWLANRNATIAAFFGVLALIAHDRWRRDVWRVGLWAAPLALLAALLAKEEAVSTGGYLLAYAVFLDRQPWPRRLLSLGPCLLVGLIWYAGYRWLGYGVFASEVYVDPAHDPLRFAARVLRNGPILLLAQVGLPPSDMSLFWSSALFRAHWLWAIGFLSFLWFMLRPLLASSAVARFWGTGMLFALLPVCAIFTNDRLLMFAGLGAMGLLAQWLAGIRDHAPWAPAGRAWKRAAGVCSFVLLAVHLILAPLAFPVLAMSMRFAGDALASTYDTLPDDQGFAQQTIVLANSRAVVADMVWIQARLEHGSPVPKRTLNLSPSCSAVALARTDARTLVVRPHGGYLQPRGLRPENEGAPAFSFRYHAQLLDMISRSQQRPMKLHETIELTDVTIEVTELTDDGRPAAVAFRFRVPLEYPSLRWLYLASSRYVPLSVPAIGETVELPSPLE